MRISIFLILCCILNVSAGLNVKSQTFDISSKDVSVKEIFRIIESKSDYRFFYNDELTEVNRLVSVDVTALNVTDILAQLFDQSKVTYKVLENNLIVIAPKQALQQLKVSGTVTDLNNQPLPGVSILIKGTVKGTVTDKDGKYSIEVPDANAVLVFSFMGYLAEEKTVGTQTSINITMIEDVKQLEEIVVIGYGKVKKVNLTGSVASVGGKDLAAIPVTNAAQALQGKVAGVTITSVDGRPDAQVSIRVRGGGSVTQSNEPLYLVDGFPVSNINEVPPSQIESISILKDASSTAIYGARGANGVVMVTTKAPKTGKVSVSYDGSYQIKTPSKYQGVLHPYDFVRLNWEFGTLFGYGDAWEMAYGLGTKYSSLNAGGIDSYKTAEFRDIQKEILKDAHSQSHSLSVSGSSEKTKYNLSFDYLDDDGLKIQSWYKRSNIIAKLQQELTKKLIFDVDFRYSNSTVFGDESQTNTIGSKLTQALRFTPVTPLGDISGNNSQLGMYETYVRPAYDPVGIINDIYNKTNTQTIRGNAALSWTIINGLTAKTEYNVSKGFGATNYFIGAFAKNTVGVEGGNATVTRANASSYRFVNTMNYTLKGLLPKEHSLDILLGEELNGNDGESSSLAGTRYPISYDAQKVFANMNQYTNQTEVTISNTESDPYRLSSYFGRINYSFKDRYLFTATLRADGSSNFAPSNRWAYFPAAAVAWRISQEPFMKSLSFVDNLKLRLSYGEAGNDRISSNLWNPLWSASSAGYSYSDIGNTYYGPATTMMTNPNLKWETTITRSTGIDFDLFSSRIYGTVDGYWNTTKDLLMVTALPAYTGYTNEMANVGQTRNIGLEISVGGDIVRNKDLKVSANFNIGFNRNKVEKLADDMNYYYYTSNWASSSTMPAGGDYALIKGQSVGLIRGYKYDGFYTTADFDYNATTQAYTLKPGVTNSRPVMGAVPGVGAGSYPGMMKLKKVGTDNSATDINEADDAVVIGNTNPWHTGGFNLNVNYKNFDLLLAFNWSYKNQIYNANKLANSYGNKLPFRNFSDAVNGYYHLFDVDASGNLVRVYDPAQLDALNANAKVPMPFHEYGVVNSSGIEDGSFLRLNNVTLGYTFSPKLTKKIAIQRFRVYGTINNAWLWTKYTGYDPEVDAGTGRNSLYPTPGMDFGAYPKARTFTFGVNVMF